MTSDIVENELILIRKALEALLNEQQFKNYRHAASINPSLVEHIGLLDEKGDYLHLQ
jgi:hypothetical protein